MRDNLTTPLPVGGHAPYGNRRNYTELQSEEANLYNNGLVFLFFGELHNYEGIKTAAAGEKLACWTEGFSTTDLDFHLEGRQTVENHLVQFVHTGTGPYAQNDVINFHLSSFFRGFYFRVSKSVREQRENLHPAKISRYTIYENRDPLFGTSRAPKF